MSKRNAFLLHLAISAAVAGTICAVIFFLWYPAPYFAVRGAGNVLAILLAVNLIVGPLLTLYLYRPNKPGVRIDMTVIPIVQLVALVYGTWIIYSERPYYTVFAVDRFQVLAEHEVDREEIGVPELLEKPISGPIFVVAVRPESEAERQKLIDEVVFQGLPDIERRPALWEPYSAHIPDVLDSIQPLERLTEAHPEAAFELQASIGSFDRDPDELGYVPLVGRNKSFAFVLDAKSGHPLGVIDVDPWVD